jgi:hypothetical protein
VIPAAEQEEGFIGALLLTRDDGRALVVDLCDTVEHMRANERSGFYQTQVAPGHPRAARSRVGVGTTGMKDVSIFRLFLSFGVSIINCSPRPAFRFLVRNGARCGPGGHGWPPTTSIPRSMNPPRR